MFRPSSTAPQSQNPQHRAVAMPAVLLNRRRRIEPESGRENDQPVFIRTLLMWEKTL
jgi:hypothetical protein